MATPESTPARSAVSLTALPPFTPDLYQRAWASVPHPTLPLLATTHAKAVTIFSLSTMSKHSSLADGHSRSVRCAAWKPGLPPHRLCLVTGSFDATAGLWRWDGDVPFGGPAAATATGGSRSDRMEIDLTNGAPDSDSDEGQQAHGRGAGGDDEDWEFTLVLEGHENEIKGAAFSPSGQYLATCSRDKSVWIWEDVGSSEADDEWETVAVLNEHDGDVKAVAWCPDVPGRNKGGGYSPDVLASASYDNTARIWREDSDGEWVCVAVLEGHEGTVWGLQWEPAPANGKFPRLLTFSADATIRIWTLREEEEPEAEEGKDAGAAGEGGSHLFRSGLGGIPNTMRRSVREDWDCTAVLPKIHTRDIYAAAWSGSSGLVASSGSDGIIAVYGEDRAEEGQEPAPQQANGAHPESDRWKILGKVDNGHGPYEINHIAWCKRFDPGTERKGEEEMLVSTGDDGIIRPWQVS